MGEVTDSMMDPVDYHWRSRIKGGAWDAWERGRAPQTAPPFMEFEERPLYLHPPNICAEATAEIERLREALKPFAEAEPMHVSRTTGDDDGEEYILTENQFRFARAALSKATA